MVSCFVFILLWEFNTHSFLVPAVFTLRWRRSTSFLSFLEASDIDSFHSSSSDLRQVFLTEPSTPLVATTSLVVPPKTCLNTPFFVTLYIWIWIYSGFLYCFDACISFWLSVSSVSVVMSYPDIDLKQHAPWDNRSHVICLHPSSPPLLYIIVSWLIRSAWWSLFLFLCSYVFLCVCSSSSSFFCLLQVFSAETCRCPAVAPPRAPSSSLTSRLTAGSCLHILSDPATNPGLPHCCLYSLCEEQHCFISEQNRSIRTPTRIQHATYHLLLCFHVFLFVCLLQVSITATEWKAPQHNSNSAPSVG